MKTIKFVAPILLTILVLITASCDNQGNKSDKVRSIGNTSEVLVVLQNDEQWDNQIGETIKKYLAQEQYGLSQAEPIFDLAHITGNNFSDMFKKHRNILIVNIDEKATSTNVESYKDKWSSPQRIIMVTSSSNSAFAENFPDYAIGIIEDYRQAERRRILSVFRPSSKTKY